MNRLRRPFTAALLGLVLAGCTVSWGNSDADAGFERAQVLRAIPITGFEFSEITGPDLGISYNNPNSYFSATPVSGELTAAECEAVVTWMRTNLTDISTALQYNTASDGQEMTACLTASYGLLKNSAPGLTYTGLYEGHPIYIVYEGAMNGELSIVVDGRSTEDTPRLYTENSDSAREAQKLLNALAAYRAQWNIGTFTDQQLTDFWENYQVESSTTARVTWTADEDGLVRSIVAAGVGPLLPFHIWIDPVNEELVGPDAGPDYLLVLGEESGPKSFGFAWSDEP